MQPPPGHPRALIEQASSSTKISERLRSEQREDQRPAPVGALHHSHRLIGEVHDDGLNFIPQADDRGLFKTTTVAFLGLSETDLGIFGGKGQNMHVVVPLVAASATPAVKAFVARVRAEAGADTTVSNYVMTHYNALIALKAAIEKAGKVDKEALIDAVEGLTIKSPTGAGDDRKKSPRHDEPVPGQDQGPRPRPRAPARRARAGPSMPMSR